MSQADDDEFSARLLAEIDLLAAQRDCDAGLRAPARLRERVLASTRAGRPELPEDADEQAIQVWKTWRADLEPEDSEGLHTVRETNADWQESAIPGISTRRLSVDAASRTVTMLIDMAPGTSYPAHRHGGPEECFVLSGDLCVGDGEVLGPGDFQRATAGSLHPVQSTVGGCRLLLTSSQDDELISA